MQQIKTLWSDFKLSQKNFFVLYKKALSKLYETYQEMGKRQVVMINNINIIQFKPFIDINYRKKIGILLPYINFELKQEEQLPAYSFENTSHHLDELIVILKEFFESLIVFAEKEDILLKLTLNLKKISRRISGLKNVIKPQLISDIKTIKEILEELERESFVRLKKTKSLIKE